MMYRQAKYPCTLCVEDGIDPKHRVRSERLLFITFQHYSKYFTFMLMTAIVYDYKLEKKDTVEEIKLCKSK